MDEKIHSLIVLCSDIENDLSSLSDNFNIMDIALEDDEIDKAHSEASDEIDRIGLNLNDLIQELRDFNDFYDDYVRDEAEYLAEQYVDSRIEEYMSDIYEDSAVNIRLRRRLPNQTGHILEIDMTNGYDYSISVSETQLTMLKEDIEDLIERYS